MKIIGFVGPSGTGKSYRAQMVAGQNDIEFIIDDGILIRDNEMIAGDSAKKAPTKIETVKRALFINKDQRDDMLKALKKYKPDGILILGTSDEMVRKIANNLNLPKIEKIIYIEEVASEDEIESAQRIRTMEGKHVIPVPTFEIKKQFSGYLLDPLQIFQPSSKGRVLSEKSIIRPTFSYIGKFTISDTVFKEIIEYLASKIPSIQEIMKIRVIKSDYGPTIYVEVKIKYGVNIVSELKEFKERCITEIERQTTMNVKNMKIIAKKIELPFIPYN